METGRIVSTFDVGGIAGSSCVTREGDQNISGSPALPAGKAGTLTTRTDDDTGVVTLAEGHGITDSDYVDVYWVGGMRYGMDVTAYDGTTVSINLGTGDVLPTQGFAVIVTKRVTIDVDFDGDNVKLIFVSCGQRAHFVFAKNDETVILAQELVAGEGWSWVSGQQIANPLTGDPVGLIYASNGSSETASTLQYGATVDST